LQAQIDQAYRRDMAQPADPSSGARSRAHTRLEAAMDERKRSFLRMVSHELRTPLNSILGFSEILAAELYGPLGAPQYKEYAGIIHGSGQKLLKLVNQVLEIARLEGRTMDFETRSEPLEVAIDDVLTSLSSELTSRDICILVQGRGDLPSVAADARGLRTVLSNLLQNAIVFSPDGGQVRISAEVHGACVDILIRDEGDGVDPDELPRLMGPFEQGENALTRKAEGAGLGLPIADLTCKAMGGRLKLTSSPGAGLTAAVRLPVGG
jgi:signal transduction histidine kinase